MQITYISPKKEHSNYLSNLQLKRKLMCITPALTICMLNTSVYASKLGTEKLKVKVNSTGNQIIDVVQLFIYWITLVCALVDIAKTVKKQDIAGVAAIVLKYGAMMGAGYAMPWLWDIIKDIFQDI